EVALHRALSPRAGDEARVRADVFHFAVDDVVDRVARAILAVSLEVHDPVRRIEYGGFQRYAVRARVDRPRNRLPVPVQLEHDARARVLVGPPVADPGALERMPELREGGD